VTSENEFYEKMWAQKAKGQIIEHNDPLVAVKNLSEHIGTYLTYIGETGIYTGTLIAEQINAVQGIVLGANAVIEWNSLQGIPATIPAGWETDLSSYVTTGAMSTSLGSYLTTTALTTKLGQDYIVTGKIAANQISAGTITGVTLKTNTVNYLSVSGSSMKGYNGTDLALDVGVQINGSYNLPYIKFIAGMYEGAPAKVIGLSSAGQLTANIDSIENDLSVYGNLTVTGTIYGTISNANYATSAGYATSSGTADYAQDANYATNSNYATSASTLSYLGSSRAVPTDTGFTSGITHIGIASGPPPYMSVNTGSSSWGVSIYASDRSLKKNIVDTTESSLAKILLIKHRQFDWKDGNRHEKVGVISQELMEIDSDFAFEVKQGLDEAGNQKPSLYQPNIPVLIPTITHAIQEMQIEIEYLKLRLGGMAT